MSDEDLTERAASEPPANSPDQSTEGVHLKFGNGKAIRLDPFELMLYFLLAFPAGAMIKEAFNPEYNFDTAIKRSTALIAVIWTIRKSPTDKVADWLLSQKVG